MILPLYWREQMDFSGKLMNVASVLFLSFSLFLFFVSFLVFRVTLPSSNVLVVTAWLSGPTPWRFSAATWNLYKVPNKRQTNHKLSSGYVRFSKVCICLLSISVPCVRKVSLNTSVQCTLPFKYSRSRLMWSLWAISKVITLTEW